MWKIRAGNGARAGGANVVSPAKYITGNPSWVLQLWLPRYTSSPSSCTAAARDRDISATDFGPHRRKTDATRAASR